MRVFQAILLSLVLFAIAEALPLRSRPDKVIRGKCVMQFACWKSSQTKIMLTTIEPMLCSNADGNFPVQIPRKYCFFCGVFWHEMTAVSQCADRSATGWRSAEWISFMLGWSTSDSTFVWSSSNLSNLQVEIHLLRSVKQLSQVSYGYSVCLQCGVDEIVNLSYFNIGPMWIQCRTSPKST